MIDPAASQAQLKEAIADCIGTDQGVLDGLREEIRPKNATRRIQARATTSISLVDTWQQSASVRSFSDPARPG